MNTLSLDEIKKIELGILNYVVDICKKNNLRYYLAYGTLIGAIRHQGFIPWDDDIDIVMPRPDYEKLLVIAENLPDSSYSFLSSRDDSYLYGFAKVYDNRTKIVDDSIEQIPQLGIWLDIFPYDGMASKTSLNNQICYCLNKFRAAAIYRNFPKEKGANFISWKLCRIIGYKFFLRFYERLCRIYPFDSSEYVGLISDKKDYHHHKYFESTIKVTFEGKEYDAPIGYDQVLRNYYGDYMQLPPEAQRQSHHIEAILI